jgi:hypothetical protein
VFFRRQRSSCGFLGGAATTRQSDFFRVGLGLGEEVLADSGVDFGSPREIAIELFQDGGGGCGPDEGLGRFVMRLDVARDDVFELGNGFEDAATDSSASDRREKPFDGVEPGGGCWGEVEGPSWMRGEPFQDIGMFCVA